MFGFRFVVLISLDVGGVTGWEHPPQDGNESGDHVDGDQSDHDDHVAVDQGDHVDHDDGDQGDHIDHVAVDQGDHVDHVAIDEGDRVDHVAVDHCGNVDNVVVDHGGHGDQVDCCDRADRGDANNDEDVTLFMLIKPPLRALKTWEIYYLETLRLYWSFSDHHNIRCWLFFYGITFNMRAIVGLASFFDALYFSLYLYIPAILKQIFAKNRICFAIFEKYLPGQIGPRVNKVPVTANFKGGE